MQVWLLLMGLAAADIAPLTEYVETCTVARACEGRAGAACSAWHGGDEECQPLKARGLVRACKTAGASTWQEVWCEPAAGAPRANPDAATSDPVTPATTEPQRRCGVAGPTSALTLAPLLFLALRRRRGAR